MFRVAITGGPNTGKTTLSKSMQGTNVRHTDDLIKLGWSESSKAASYLFDDLDIYIIEGVAVPRALRKWLKRNIEGKPVDKIIYLNHSHIKLNTGQVRMAKGCKAVWNKILPELIKRGVEIDDRSCGDGVG